MDVKWTNSNDVGVYYCRNQVQLLLENVIYLMRLLAEHALSKTFIGGLKQVLIQCMHQFSKVFEQGKPIVEMKSQFRKQNIACKAKQHQLSSKLVNVFNFSLAQVKGVCTSSLLQVTHS